MPASSKARPKPLVMASNACQQQGPASNSRSLGAPYASWVVEAQKPERSSPITWERPYLTYLTAAERHTQRGGAGRR